MTDGPIKFPDLGKIELSAQKLLINAAAGLEGHATTADLTDDQRRDNAIRHIPGTIIGALKAYLQFNMITVEDCENVLTEIINTIKIDRIQYAGEDITDEVLEKFQEIKAES